jgi:hypothetical protein
MDGVPDTLANAGGRRQAEEFRRFYFRNRLIALLRIRKRLRQSLQKSHESWAAPRDNTAATRAALHRGRQPPMNPATTI